MIKSTTYVNLRLTDIQISQMTSFMKPHPELPHFELSRAVLPLDLLRIKSLTPLPFERHGFGQLGASVVKVVAPEWCLPIRRSEGAAGFEIYSPIAEVVPPRGSVVIDTQVVIELPRLHYGKIEGVTVSGLCHDIVPFGCIVDEDFRGSIKVKLFNFSDDEYTIHPRDQIAQLIVQPYVAPIMKGTSMLKMCGGKFGGFQNTWG